jgi:hypothetical protein
LNLFTGHQSAGLADQEAQEPERLGLQANHPSVPQQLPGFEIELERAEVQDRRLVRSGHHRRRAYHFT